VKIEEGTILGTKSRLPKDNIVYKQSVGALS